MGMVALAGILLYAHANRKGQHLLSQFAGGWMPQVRESQASDPMGARVRNTQRMTIP